jgi:hypothetical protein
MKPEELYQEAENALQVHDYQRATAFATSGLLALHIGAAKAVAELGLPMVFK